MKIINQSCAQIIYILIILIYSVKVNAQDTTPPVMVIPPISASLPCEGVDPTNALINWYNTAGGAMATDNSGTVIYVPNIQLSTAINIFNNSKDTLCGNTKKVKISWVASDPSGNITPMYFATFSLVDLLPPSIFVEPTSSSIECTSTSQDSLIRWIKRQGGAKGIDVCSPTVEWVTYNYSTSTGLAGTDSIKNGPYPIIPTNVCNWSVSISFKVIDECGQETVSSIRRFEVRDTKAPVLSSTPANVTVQCDEVPPRPAITAVDACAGNLNVTFSETKTQNSDTTKCDHYNYSITRKWSSVDVCNNTVEHTQKITVIDDRAPIISGNATKTIECSQMSAIDSLLTVRKDNCSPVFIIFQDSTISGASCKRIVKRKYEARDVCQNRSLFSQIITTEDRNAPVVSISAKDNGIDCNEIADVNATFNTWLSNRGGSIAADQCGNGMKSFAAVPGSYNLKDTLTFPGTHPGALDITTCGLSPSGFSRAEKVDFVYYDACGNASVTSATYGVKDNFAPVVSNCPTTITKEVDAIDCTAHFDINVPPATDDCSQFGTSLLKFATASIKSNAPGDNELKVNPVTLRFGPYNANTFVVDGNATLTVDLISTDADDISEFFTITDEQDNVLGQTTNTPLQCSNSQTSITINQAMIATLIADGFIDITLTPNEGPIPTLSINDICPTLSKANGALSFPIKADNQIKIQYTDSTSGDTTDISSQTSVSKIFPTGDYIIKLIYSDCAKNKTTCAFELKIVDRVVPVMNCPKDTVVTAEIGNCDQPINIPLSVFVTDNCQFPIFFNETAPSTAESQKLTFKFIENGNIHVVNNKIVTFNNTPLIKYADTDVELKVNLSGDFNNDKEFFYIVGESGFPIGSTSTATSNQCVNVSNTFIISKNKYNEWAADGKIEITAVANIEGNEEGLSINPCNTLSPNQTVDDFSKITMQLTTRQPVIHYQLDNDIFKQIPGEVDTLAINVPSGKHNLVLNTQDQGGNIGACTIKLEVKDNEAPVAKCKNFIGKIHPSGLIDLIIPADSIDNNSSDNCKIDSTWTSTHAFKCADVGTEKSITLFVKDEYDNIGQCNAKVKIESTTLQPTFTSGLCDGDTLRLFSNVPPPIDNNVFTYEWYKDNILVSNVQNPIFPNTNSGFNGLYKVVAKGFDNCFAEGIMNINIKPLSTPVLNALQDSYCDDEEILLMTDNFSGNVKYEWYEGFPPNGILIGNTTVAEFRLNANAGIHNYYVLGRSPECVSNPSLTKRIFVYKRPEIVLNSYFQNVCEGGNIVLGTTTTGSNLKYSWKGPGFESTLQNPAPITNAQNINQGKYQLVVNIDECRSDTAISNVVILPKPSRPVITGESTYCEGSTFSIVVKNIPNQEKYIWIKDGLRYTVTQDNSLEIINVPVSATGKWQVVVESNGCQSDTSDVKIIDIDNLTLVGASNDGPHCEGDSIELNATFVPNAEYKWTGPKDFVGIGQTVKAPSFGGEYFVTIQTTTGCVNVTSTTVEVNISPIITALSNNSGTCVDGKSEVTFFPSVIPQGNYKYMWTGPNFSSDLVNPKISNVSELNNGKYTLTVINKNCASEPEVSTIDVQLIPPKANFSMPSSICEGQTLTITTTVQADSFNWHTPTGIITTDKGELVIDNIKKSQQGNYHLIIKKGRCSSEDFNVNFLEVKPKPLPVAIVGEDTICYGATINLSTNTSNLTDAQWTLPNGDKINGKTIAIGNAVNNNQGEYKVIVNVDGCLSEISQPFNVVVKDEIEPPILKEPQIQICSNENIAFEACINSLESGINYVWINQSNGAIIGNSQALCINFNTNNFNIGQNFVSVKAQQDGCESLIASQLQIDKNEAPNIKAIANIDEITACNADDLIELTSTIKEPLVDVEWRALSAGVEIITPQLDRTIIQNFQKGLNLVLLSYSKDGCRNFSNDTVKILVYDNPQANDDFYDIVFNENKSFNILVNDTIGRSYQITVEEPSIGNLSGSNGNYTYEPQTGFAGNIKLNYTLCVEGCDNLCDEAQITFSIGDGIDCVVPTIITPNNDGINDEFIIPCLNVGNYPNNELIIFNQWGDEVYSAKPYTNQWRGTYGDEPLPVGTYFYVFNKGNGDNRLNGFFIIQR